MEIEHILRELAFDGDLPREAMEAAVAKREEITPHLLKILQDAIDRVDEIIEDDNYCAHLYAMYLLAQFREKKAYSLIVKLLSFPGEIPHFIAGDILTEDLGRILASLCDEITELKALIENPLHNEYVRAAGLNAIVTLVGCKKISRDECIVYFKTLFENKLEKSSSFVWDTLVASSVDIYPEELLPEISLVFANGLIDTAFISKEDVENVLKIGKVSHTHSFFQRSELIDDAVTEMEKWISCSC